MPRQVNLFPHLSSSQLKKKYRQSQDKVESRRWHLLWKVSLGWTLKNSAIAVGLSYGYAKTVIKKYNQQGEQGIKNQRRTKQSHSRGKKPLLNEQQLQKLLKELKQRPSDGGLWTGPKVARWIEKETGVEKVWNPRGWEYLKKLRYSWKKPRPKHRKGEKKKQEEFKKQLPLKVKNLQKEHPNAQIEVWFFDEHRVGLKPIIKKVWSPKGEKTTAVVQHRYEWLYVYAFVEPKSGKTHWYLIPRVNTSWLNLVLKTFASEVGAGRDKIIFLVEDRAGWHRSDSVKLPEGLVTELLPPYSPELQPAERLWLLVDEPLVNEHFETIEELENVLAKRCCALQNMTEEIKKLTNYHWLTYA